MYDRVRPSATVVVPVDPRPDDAGRTLGEVLDLLGGHALQLVTPAARLDRRMGEVVVHGQGEPVPPAAGGLLLIPGRYAGQARLADALREAARAGYHAVVVKAFGDDLAELVAVAGETGLALLTTPDEMTWRHLDALVGATRLPAYGAGPDRFAVAGQTDLFALANAIASAIGGAVTIEDPTGRMMAYSNLPDQEIDAIRRDGILGRQTPERPTNHAEYQAVLRSDSPVYFQSPAPAYASRMAVAIRAGGEALGVIWVLTDRPPVVDRAELVLVDAARATAVHLLRARGQRDPERARRSSALRRLLDGSLAPRSAAAELAVALETPSVVLVVAPAGDQGDRLDEPIPAAARITELVALVCETWHSSATCVADGGVVQAWLPVRPGDRDEAGLLRFGTELAATVRRSAGLEVLVGIGPAVPELGELADSRLLADRVLGVLAGQAGPRVATLDQVRTEVVLRSVAEHLSTAEEHLLGPADSILRYDAQHGTTYAETLLTYLCALGDVVRAAGRLQVHQNTLRYRIRRAETLFGLTLDDGDQVLGLWLQLRLARQRNTR